MPKNSLQDIFPKTLSLLEDWNDHENPEVFLRAMKGVASRKEAPPYIHELAQIEQLLHKLRTSPPAEPENIKGWAIRRGVELLEASWSGLPDLINDNASVPVNEKSFVLIFPGRNGDQPTVTVPDEHDLLAMKICVEELDIRKLARESQASPSYFFEILERGAGKGIVQKPTSQISRPSSFAISKDHENFLQSNVFTLQWHITQQCDLHCRHCYDRSDRETMSLEAGLQILEQLHSFCTTYRVRGQVSFSGGNPLLYPHFIELYRAAVEMGFMVAILGNPTGRKQLKQIVAIKSPEFYQISLEGLKQHNDYIRGPGHFDRSLKFLKLLHEFGIYRMVMLTLTKANQAQVIPLAELLREKTDLFTFNRLSMVGEGAALTSSDQDGYRHFLKNYHDAAQNNSVMGLKDNLFNLLQKEANIPVGGGCAGYGCGAAFNFVSLLPDGQVHACRKLPSLLGNIYEKDLTIIYEGDEAEKYRLGSSGCADCEIRPVCGGCPAVTYGFGDDIFNDIDPYCFKKHPS